MSLRDLRISLGIVAALLLCSTSSAETLFVQPNESIQSAIDAAEHGDEIVVATGTYFESISLVGKNLILRSEYPDDPQAVAATVLDASGMNYAVRCASGENAQSSIVGFTIRNSAKAGISIENSSPTVRNCVIKDNKDLGCHLNRSGSNLVDSSVTLNAWGVRVWSSKGVSILDSDISANLNNGLSTSSSDLLVRESRIESNRRGGILVQNRSHLRLFDSWVMKNRYQYDASAIDLSRSDADIRNCTISENQADSSGYPALESYDSSISLRGSTVSNNVKARGIRISGEGTTLIEDTSITGNGSGGLSFFRSSSPPRVVRCAISVNGWYGLYGEYDANPEIYDCEFIGNVGGGLFFSDDARPFLDSCSILNNQGIGVHCQHNSWPRLENCVIAGNRGGFFCRNGSSPLLYNCTVASNDADWGGGLNFDHSSFPRITNTILWNPGSELVGIGPPLVRYSCVQGGFVGDEVVDANPRFVDPNERDYRLQDGSSCVDRGWLEEATTLDLEGTKRPGGDGLVDIGAYESPDDFLPGDRHHVPRILRVRSDAPEGGDGSAWGNAFRTVSEALDFSGTSDEIWVAGGVYPEVVALDDKVWMMGGFGGTESSRGERDLSSNPTLVNASGYGRSAASLGRGAVLDGFILTGGDSSDGGGARLGEQSVLRNCVVRANRARLSGGGVWSDGGDLENCLIVENESLTDGGAAAVWRPTRFVNCTLVDNRAASRAGGVFPLKYTGSTFVNCIVWNRGTEFEGLNTPTVSNSCVQGGWPGPSNLVAPPRFNDRVQGDYTLGEGSPCIDRGARSEAPGADIVGRPRTGIGNLPDIGAYEAPPNIQQGLPHHVPRVLHVDSEVLVEGNGVGWANAFRSIPIALAESTLGDELWIRMGVYPEALHMEPGIQICGGFNGSEMERSLRNWFAYPTVILSSTKGVPCLFSTAENVTVSGLILARDQATAGPAVSLLGGGARLDHCVITGNRVTDSQIDESGIVCNDVDLDLVGCVVSAHAYRGLTDYASSRINTSGCIFAGNASSGLAVSRNAVVSDSLIVGNRARDGGGILVGSTPLIRRCSIVDNYATQWGSGIFGFRVHPRIENCIVFNTGREINAIGDRTVTYSCVEEVTEGRGNITTPPKFVSSLSVPESGYTGVWSSDPVFFPGRNQTVFVDENAEWESGAWRGLPITLKPSATYIQHFVLVENTTTTLTVWGDATGYANQGDSYVVCDYRLREDSPCVDTGDGSPLLGAGGMDSLNTGDLLGRVRVWDGDMDGTAVLDMGAVEYGPPPKVGDVDENGELDGPDLFGFSSSWKNSEWSIAPASNLNGDRNIDAKDLLWWKRLVEGQVPISGVYP